MSLQLDNVYKKLLLVQDSCPSKLNSTYLAKKKYYTCLPAAIRACLTAMSLTFLNPNAWPTADRGQQFLPVQHIDTAACSYHIRICPAAAGLQYAIQHPLVVIILPGAPSVQAAADQPQHVLHTGAFV